MRTFYLGKAFFFDDINNNVVHAVDETLDRSFLCIEPL